MRLKFNLDLASAMRRGIDCKQPSVVLDIDPAQLSERQRNSLADRILGYEIHPLRLRCVTIKNGSVTRLESPRRDFMSHLLPAASPTLEALLEAVEKNEHELESEINAFIQNSNSQSI